MSRQRIGYVGLFFVILGLLYWVGWRSRLIHVPGEPRNARVVAEEQRLETARSDADDLYKKILMMEKSNVDSIEQLDETIGSLIGDDLARLASVTNGAYETEKLSKIREDIIGLMYHRWVQPSFDAYDAFMRSHGYSVPGSWEQLSSGHQAALAGSYLIWTNTTLDSTRPPIELIRELWEAGSPGEGRAADLRAISIDPDGVEVASRRVCPGEMLTAELGGRLGQIGWEGASGVACVQYYQPGLRRPFDLQKSGRCVDIARVGVVLRFKGEETHPFIFSCWFNPEDENWYIYSISIQNYEEGFGGVFF